jgi:hypothetical protein
MVNLPAYFGRAHFFLGTWRINCDGIQDTKGNGFHPYQRHARSFLATMTLMGVSFLIMGLTGLVLPFLIHIWNRGYIWASIVLMLFVAIYMAVFNETRYKQLRRLVGLPYMKGSKQLPAEPPSNPEEVAALLAKSSVTGLVVVGYIIPAFVLWLMIFKPF